MNETKLPVEFILTSVRQRTPITFFLIKRITFQIRKLSESLEQMREVIQIDYNLILLFFRWLTEQSDVINCDD